MFKLKSCDGQIFEASKQVLETSLVLSHLLEASAFQEKPGIIPIQNVNASILSKILEFCQIYAETDNEGDGKGDMNTKQLTSGIKFIQDNQQIIPELTKAADYLQIQSFLDFFKNLDTTFLESSDDLYSATIFLKSSDDVYFAVYPELCNFSKILATRLEDEQPAATENSDDIKPIVQCFPILNVSAKILRKILEYCEFHLKASLEDVSENELEMWDKEFMKVDQSTLFEIILGANYLVIGCLLDLTCRTIANMIKGKTPEEIRETFGIKNDLTPEQEEELRRDIQWGFD